ncbi:MAG: fused signal transduction protein/response regulator [Gallionellales bacterium 35-53-114]|jgi:two-component system chemotaxis response regulator CheV|nr:MAG: fused signal transduction protein/response regulator [Gallionellales bacterium 35-53-114]OYZ64257.1 MAG: fused signal transduction protein/response regulator [Gallionellales bacterium 24-53-125]OZB10435.1 MAG: fused signal transduction protein/response regulator [Gallionellales bacterium 39-52-133]HQS57049.1 chemotaxis protein [Gallionellaceae bacterium]HQS74763.1 chemotaxis protein [Gallionellaceae bacterium]
MSDLFKDINARTKLAGTNKLEILMFTLGKDNRSGRRETYGINVFKVREVMRIPAITKAPDMPASVEGMVSLRGVLVPVIDLAKYTNMQTDTQPSIMIVTEYNGHTQGFLVEAVDTILRLDWASMKVPPEMLNAQLGGLVVAVTELPDKRLVMMMDVEKVLSDTGNFGTDEVLFKHIKPISQSNRTVFYVDDSPVARKQISRTLDAMGVHYIAAVNGHKAWEELKRLADSADIAHIPVSDLIQVILTDVEMPEMDGYMLTRKIKEDQRFANIPVLMHSSLSSLSNQQLGKAVGVDEYVPKFEPQKLSQTLMRLLG